VKPFYILLISIFIFIPLAKGQTFKWADTAGGWVNDYATNTIFDEEGNVYITGHANGGTAFGNFNIYNWGFFIVKYNQEGTVVWARFGDGSYNGQGVGLALDSDGSIYVGGTFSHVLYLEDTTLHGAHQSKGFLVKYSSGGELLWAKNLGNNESNSWDIGGLVAVDKDDNVYVSGGFSGNILLEGGVVLADNYPYYWPDRDIYLIKYDKNGKIIWGKSAGTFNDDIVRDLVIGSDNIIYMSVHTGHNEFTFGDDKFDVHSNGSILLGCTVDGDLIWQKSLKGSVTDLAIDTANNLYATGWFGSEISFSDNNKLNAEIHGSMFVVKYMADKEVEWSKKIKVAASALWQPRIAVSDSAIYLGSTFNENLESGRFVLQEDGVLDMFLLKLNQNGYEQWIKLLSSNYWDMLEAVAVSKQGSIAITGHYKGESLHLDSLTLKNNSGNNNSDIFIAIIDDPVPTICPAALPALFIDKERICADEKATLSASVLDNNQIQWFKNEQKINRTPQSSLIIDEPGEYYFVVYDGYECSRTSNKVNLRIVEKPDTSLVLSPAVISCDRQPIKIEASNNQNYSYQWFKNGALLHGQTHNNLLAYETGTYHVLLLNEGMCGTESKRLTLEVLPSENDFLPDTIYRCAGETISISPANLNYNDWNYLWSTNHTTTSLFVDLEGLYSLRISKGNCMYTDQVYVKDYEDLWVPNVITPNGDNLNDVFVIENLQRPISLTVYNRWGNVVYNNESYYNTWSATDVANGVYYYLIEDKAGCLKKKSYKGWLQILR
jgi:gliding motility-associated-like protein